MHTEYTFFGRQAILDHNQDTWGFELLYRASADAQSADYSDADSATLQVAASAMSSPQRVDRHGQFLLINFTETSILQGLPYVVPADATVIQVPETLESPDALDQLKGMKEQGYRVALDGFTNSEPDSPLLGIADTLIIDVKDIDETTVKTLVNAPQAQGKNLIAKRVEDKERFAFAKGLGFPLFQGYFFTRPEIVANRRLSSNEISRFKLLKFLEKNGEDLQALAQAIATDVSLSYRLLFYLNSPGIGLPNKVNTIMQAVAMLGWRKTGLWLRLAILTDIADKSKPSELPFLSLNRAKFLEMVALKSPSYTERSDSLFLLGLFSLLDALLDIPLAEIVDHLALDAQVREALAGKNNTLSPWLDLAVCFETGDWPRLDTLAQVLTLAPETLAECYADALSWSNTFFDLAIE